MVSPVDSYGITDMHIPAPGYDLIRQIKELDGRISWLDAWVKEIKTYVANSTKRAAFEKFATEGPRGRRELRVVLPHQRAARQTFDYDRYLADHGRDAYERVVRSRPPKVPTAIRLASPIQSKLSREWTALAQPGKTAMAEMFPGRDAWKAASPLLVSQGLWDISQLKNTYSRDKEELRENLGQLAYDGKWENALMGRDDGRLWLSTASGTRELRDREGALRELRGYFKTGNKPAKPVVGFYAPGAESFEDEAD